MKHSIILITFLLSGCNCHRQNNNADFMKEVREDFAKQAEEFNDETLAWEDKLDILYNRTNKNLKDGVFYADSLIKVDSSLDKWKISELHTVIGELYYDKDSIDLALERFHLDEFLTFDSPRNKANKAGCYVKKGDLKKAMTLLEQATETNDDYKWYIGNLYEIENQKNKAIEQYEFLYQKDTTIYAYCKNRIDKLNQHNPQLFTELLYRERGQKTLLLLKGVDSTATPTTIGVMEMDKIDRK